MEFYKMMIISSGHVSKKTASLLDEDNVGVIVYDKKNYGWFIVVSDWQDVELPIPDDLKQCLAYAENCGCDWLCLDCDGEQCLELPFYNW